MSKEASLIKIPQNIELRAGIEKCLIYIVLFFLGHTVLFDALAPFGLAFLMADRSLGYRTDRAAAVAIIAGGIMSGDFGMLGVYAAAYAGSIFCYRRLSRVLKRLFGLPLIACIFIICGGILARWVGGSDLYGQAVVIFDGVLYLLTVRLFAYGIGAAREYGLRYEEEKDEIFICLFLMFALAVVGMAEISWQDYSLAAVAGSVGIMLAALIGGVSFGAAAGVVIGAMMIFTNADAARLIMLYSLSGIMGGALREFGKNGIVIGFGCGSLLIGLWYIPLNLYSEHVAELLCSVALFMLLPVQRIEQLVAETPPEPVKEPSFRASHKPYEKLQALADVFLELGRLTDSSLKQAPAAADMECIDTKISEAVKPVCSRCENCQDCWERYGFQTYRCLLNFFAEKNSKSGLKLPIGECEHEERLWQRLEDARLYQSRLDMLPVVFNEQLKSLGQIIENIACHIDTEATIEKRRTEKLIKRCAEIGCLIEKAESFGQGSAQRLKITKPACANEQACLSRIKPLAEEIFDCKFSVKKRCSNYPLQKKCYIVMEAQRQFRSEIGWATVAKDEFGECGDIISDITLPDGRVAVCLSDGMGSGAQAANESRLVQGILKKLLTNDFSLDLTMQLLNILLMINADRDNFAAVDLAVLNLSDGRVKFLKAAAAPSYIKRIREIKQIEVASLPAGIIAGQSGEAGCLELQLAANDYLVMISDGIEDIKNIKYVPSDREGWFIRYLRQMADSEPEELARLILMEAVKMCGGRPQDDFSVAVVRLQKN